MRKQDGLGRSGVYGGRMDFPPWGICVKKTKPGIKIKRPQMLFLANN
jgi:hypothetical protein